MHMFNKITWIKGMSADFGKKFETIISIPRQGGEFENLRTN